MKKIWWYFFDMGNSAHALLISTIGFSLYFKDYLYDSKPEGSTVWGAVTSLVLLISAILSPLLTTLFVSKGKRAWGLSITTVVCVFATYLLSTKLSNDKTWAILLYFISAVTYYLALPIYNTYINDVKGKSTQTTSGTGWGLGYLGGILAALICLKLGYLNIDVKTNPDLYKHIFIVAAIFNLIFSLPLMFYSFINKKEQVSGTPFKLSAILNVLKKYSDYKILRTLVIYWLIGEVATVVTYYFAIFLTEYTNLTTKEILTWSVFGQIIAIASTIIAGELSYRFGGKKILSFVIGIWIFIPMILFLQSKHYLPFQVSIVSISLVIGAYHAIIRGNIAQISEKITDPIDKGSLFGFLEVSGRFSQVLGPLFMTFLLLFLQLNIALLFVTLFPIGALILMRKVSWKRN